MNGNRKGVMNDLQERWSYEERQEIIAQEGEREEKKDKRWKNCKNDLSNK